MATADLATADVVEAELGLVGEFEEDPFASWLAPEVGSYEERGLGAAGTGFLSGSPRAIL